MPAADHQAFSERLKAALKRLPKAVTTAADLAHEFNLRSHGEPVSNQAAHKWISGKSRPSRANAEVLAEWLGVSSHWLLYGSPPQALAKKPPGARRNQGVGHLSEKETRLLSRLRTLSEHQVFLIAELVEQLALEREVSGAPSE